MQVIEYGLRHSPDTLCIDVNPGHQPAACVRSSDARFLLEVSLSEAMELVGTIKQMLVERLAPTGLAIKTVDVDGITYDVRSCPQMRGEITILRRLEA